MYKVLITGGIGVGKSTVCQLFEEEFQIPVFYSDYHAAQVMNNDKKLIKSVKESFGDHLYNGKILDRKALADIVFNDPDKLELLNSIVHPAVKSRFEGWCDVQDVFDEGNPYVVEEAAIAFELGIQDDFDYIIVVTADEDVRVKRVMNRDKCSEEKVRERIENQLPEDEKIKHADAVIENGNVSDIEHQVKDVHNKILKILENGNK